MSQRNQAVRLTVLAVMVMVTISTVPVSVSAQSAGNATVTTTAPEDDPVEVSDQLGDLVIHDYEYRAGAGVMVPVSR